MSGNILQPEDDSFEAVNDFVHTQGVSFEELQWALLSLATKHEALEASRRDWQERAQAAEKALCDLWPLLSGVYVPEQLFKPYRGAMEAARAIVEARKDGA